MNIGKPPIHNNEIWSPQRVQNEVQERHQKVSTSTNRHLDSITCIEENAEEEDEDSFKTKTKKH